MFRTTALGIRIHIMATRNSVERVRISRDGSVYALGVMPNTAKRGWYFAGWNKDILAEIHQAVADADAKNAA